LAVSEKDINNVQLYSSIDQYNRVRGQQTLTPLEKSEAERILSTQEQQFKQRIMKKEYQSNLRTMEYEQKNKTVLSSFLQLRN
jgi:predicted phage tail protein